MTRHIACFALFTLIATAAGAQQPPDPQPGPDPHAVPDPPAVPDPRALPDPQDLVKPPDELPKPSRGERFRSLDFLFGALKAAPDEASAKAVEDRIWGMWTAAGNETTIC